MNRKHKRPRRRKHSITETPQAENIQKAPSTKAQVKRRKELVEGRQAAYEQLVSDELCMKLAGRFARESAKATGDDTATIRVHYDEIVTELRCLLETQSGAPLT